MIYRPHLSAQWIFWLLISIFVIPLIAAYFLSTHHEQMGLGTKNHGQLINPALHFNTLNLQDAQLKPIASPAWRGHWLLLLVVPKNCDRRCEKQIYQLQQIRTATGKESNRVIRGVLTFTRPPGNPLPHLLQTRFPGTYYFLTSASQFQQLVHGSVVEKVAFEPGNIYLVDPLGNLLMVYPPQTDPMGIFKDLTLLLKVSNIG